MLKKDWINVCMNMAVDLKSFTCGARKILTHQSFALDLGGRFTIVDAGYTNAKLTMLKRLYYDEDHTKQVSKLWDRRVSTGKYGSVSVNTYHHLTKADPTKGSRIASVMGPCLLGVSLTLLNNRATSVDVFYRTTELFKKFPADLILLRDVILPHFNIQNLQSVYFHFANVTCHPMYFINLVPSFEGDILDYFERLRVADPKFFKSVIKWTSKYTCDELVTGIVNYAQGMRVRAVAHQRLDDEDLKILADYCRQHLTPQQETEEIEDEDD